jgi:hypothetical protein
MREAVRSGRRANFFITENRFIDCYAAKVGGSGVAVYSILQRCANSETRETWISADRMAEVLDMDRSTVYRQLKQLENLRLIRSMRTREKTIYVVLPVPAPPKEAESTPLFDATDPKPSSGHFTWSPIASERISCDNENELQDRDSSVASTQSNVAQEPPSGRAGKNRNKEEQDSLNKTQFQDSRNKSHADVMKAAQTVVRGLGLPEEFMSAAVAAVEKTKEQWNVSADSIAIRLVTDANAARRKNIQNTEFLRDFLAQKLASQIVRDLSLSVTRFFVEDVAASVKAEAAYAQSSLEEAATFITGVATEDRDSGKDINRSYFENTKWRNRGRTGKGQQQFERIRRARDEAHAIIDAQMDR